MNGQSCSEDCLVHRARINQNIIRSGYAVGFGLLLGGACFSAIGGSVETPVTILRWATAILTGVSFLFSLCALFVLFAGDATYGDDNEEKKLRRHSQYGAASFIGACYALCIIIVVGDASGVWLLEFAFGALVTACLVIYLGRAYTRGDL